MQGVLKKHLQVLSQVDLDDAKEENLANPNTNRFRTAPIQRIELYHPTQPKNNEHSLLTDPFVSQQNLGLEFRNSPHFEPQTLIEPQYPMSPSNDPLIEQQIEVGSGLQMQNNHRSNFLLVIKAKRITKNLVLKLLRKANLLKLTHLKPTQLSYVTALLDPVFIQDQSDNSRWANAPVFDTQNRLTLAWDIIQMLMTMFSFFWYPFKLSFPLQTQLTTAFEITCIALIAGDIIMSLNRAKIEKGQIIRDRATISQIYFHGMFLSDSVSGLTLFLKLLLPVQFYSLTLTILYMIMRLPRVWQIIDNLIEYYNIRGFLLDTVQLVSMLTTLILIVHVIACIWHAIAFYSTNEETWITHYGFASAPAFQRYLASFYWAAMTMTTVGYGDITPKSEEEYICANITMMVVCVVFGYTMNRIGMLLHSIQQRRADFQKNISLLNIYMSRNRVKFELQSRIRSYLQYMWEQEVDQNDHEINSLVSKLSSSLQDELNYQVKGNVLGKLGLFEAFSNDMLKRVSSIIEEVRYAPEETIIQQDYREDMSLYIVKQGEVTLKTVQNGFPLNFNVGQILGEVAFFTAQPRQVSAVSKNFTTLLRIQRENFVNLLPMFEKDREIFNQIKDSLIFQQQYSILKIQCSCCQSDTHLLSECPYLKQRLDREHVIMRHLYPHRQPRKRFTKRRPLRGFKTRINMKSLNASIKQIQNQLFEEEAQSSGDIYSGSHLPYDDQGSYNSGTPSPIPRGTSIRFVSADENHLQDDSVANSRSGDLLHQENFEEISQVYRKINESKKQSFQTAGFGRLSSNKEPGDYSVQNPMILIPENFEEGTSSSEESNTPKQLEPVQRSRNPKPLTFHHQTSQSTDPIRRGQSYGTSSLHSMRTPGKVNSRSLTYSPIQSNYQSYQSNTYNTVFKNMRTVGSRTRGVSSASASNGMAASPEDHRNTSRSKSNTANKSQGFSKFSGLENPIFVNAEFGIPGFERMQSFRYFFPHNNYNFVIRRANKALKVPTKSLSPYSFDLWGIKRAEKIRRFCERSPRRQAS